MNAPPGPNGYGSADLLDTKVVDSTDLKVLAATGYRCWTGCPAQDLILLFNELYPRSFNRS